MDVQMFVSSARAALVYNADRVSLL